MSPAAAASGVMTVRTGSWARTFLRLEKSAKHTTRVRLRPRLLINKPVPYRLGHGVMVRA
jgi:hypothetical protein